MKFIENNDRIHCVRTVYPINHHSSEKNEVISFDKGVKSVPDEVASALTSEELKKLELWMIERALLQNDFENHMVKQSALRALPCYLQKVIDTVSNIDRLNGEQLKLLTKQWLELGQRLNALYPLAENGCFGLPVIHSTKEPGQKLANIQIS